MLKYYCRIVLLSLVGLLVANGVYAGNKPQKLLQGYEGIELYHKQTDTGGIFLLSLRSKLLSQEIVIPLDSCDLMKFALNYSVLSSPEYTDEAFAEITSKVVIVKLGKMNCIVPVETNFFFDMGGRKVNTSIYQGFIKLYRV